ncbi:MAG: hypothetical protein U1B83_03210 [Candidatus Cloacimonadaceae bacterium]|nr:hypothetical protein [Candidatus Cloacimonadaceae bacterium]
MKKYMIGLAMLLALAISPSLKAVAVEDWINSFISNAREVKAEEYAAAGVDLLAECDSLWNLLISRLDPVDESFFRSQNNPIILKAGTYVVSVEYDAASNSIPLAAISALGFATHEGMMHMIYSNWLREDGMIHYALDPDMEQSSLMPTALSIEVQPLLDQFDAALIQNAKAAAEKEASREAQEALNAIRKVYDVVLQTSGTLNNLSIANAVYMAKLHDSTLRNWQFSIVTSARSSVPMIFLAAYTGEDKMFEGKKVWYDVKEARYHGMGVDNAEWVD